MTYRGIQIESLAFHGPDKVPAIVTFNAGLNVIYGASDTGKSFIVETIDFMLGAKGPLTDFKESNGYDRILLAVSSGDENFTIARSMSGGAFEVFDGLFSDTLPDGPGRALGDVHSAKDTENLSAFLLDKIGLSDRKIKKNQKDETQNLSFRNLARLCIVNEEEIIQKRSPLSDGNYTADTANTSVFRLLLTGLDDSALTAISQKSPEEQKREAQLELLDQLIGGTERRIKDLSGNKDDLEAQEDRLSAAMEERSNQLSVTEEYYKRISTDRRSLMKRREDNRNRHAEVATLLVRFQLLREHYRSDMERLLSIQEAGSIIATIDANVCPVCGSSAKYHKTDVCAGDVSRVTSAATSEIKKIDRRAGELEETIASLEKEQRRLEGALPGIEARLRERETELQQVIAPDLRKQRASYKELADKGANVREALGLFDTMQDLLARKSQLEQVGSSSGETTTSVSRLTDTMVAPFSELVEKTLKSWAFPGSDRVHFDLQVKDLVISGKARTSYGKGLRAITQAAFSISLLEFCASQDKPHPGFVILDSPLLSYKEPESADDDLSATNLNGNFYRYLLQLKSDRQVIVVENTDPPSDVELGDRVEHFSGMEDEGRFGLFPVS
ncbi:hypothetical protein AB9K29_00450 [Phaeobacter italicus]|jgi:DNA repair ATPase RecN|uniref:hypothetical protein n=1 Tax=Roseobacteraceae TaxID=2854170 RepID=UPI0035145625